MLPKKQLSRWGQFYISARKNDLLDERTTLMVHLAAAMSMGCSP